MLIKVNSFISFFFFFDGSFKMFIFNKAELIDTIICFDIVITIVQRNPSHSHRVQLATDTMFMVKILNI